MAIEEIPVKAVYTCRVGSGWGVIEDTCELDEQDQGVLYCPFANFLKQAGQGKADCKHWRETDEVLP